MSSSFPWTGNAAGLAGSHTEEPVLLHSSLPAAGLASSGRHGIRTGHNKRYNAEHSEVSVSAGTSISVVAEDCSLQKLDSPMGKAV